MVRTKSKVKPSKRDVSALPRPATEAERTERINRAITAVRRSFGEEAIRVLTSEQKSDVQVISLGAMSLDAALGVGGLPRGRIVEIFGPEASGKTTVALHAVASAQAEGGVAVFIDAEHSFDPQYAGRIGVDLDSLLVSQPESGEQALEICEELVRSGAVDIVVIDSVAALVPRAELEGQMGDAHVGLQARLMSQALRKLAGAVSKTNTCLVFINQLREKIGVMFGSPETTPGGRALKFYTSVRIDLRRIGTQKSGEVAVANIVRAKIVKNKVAPPFRICEFEIRFGHGIDRTADLLDLAVEHEIVQKSGSWFKLDGTSLGQGREQAVAFFDAPENRELYEQVRGKLMVQLFPERIASDPEAKAEAEDKTEDKAEDKKKNRSEEIVDATG